MSITIPVPPGATSLELTWTQDPPPGLLPVVGTDKAAPWQEVAAAAGGLAGFRGYNGTAADVPLSWPGIQAGPLAPGVTTPVISIKPDMTALLAGSLDAALAGWFAQVPDGAYVTCWHEGESLGNGFPADQILAMHARCMALFGEHAPATASYGQIFESFSATNGRIAPFAAPDLDFAFADGYGRAAADTPASVFGPWLEQLRAAGVTAPVGITETNALTNRPAWFTAAYAWCVAEGGLVFMPFFEPGQFAWDPADTATIAALRAILKASKGER